MAAKQISLKLLISKERNRVIFAEADNDFVDILLSFLTFPMGTIIKQLGKESTVGCMDNLYQSIQNLDVQYLRTDACKTMLLHPKNTAEALCNCLVFNIETPENYYICSTSYCEYNGHRLISSVKNVRCFCGKQMDRTVVLQTPVDVWKGKGVFVRETMRYIVSDALCVTHVSIANIFSPFKELGLQSQSALEERTVNVGINEILYLLKRALLSNTPLSDTFLGKMGIVGPVKLEEIDMAQYQPSTGTSSNSNKMKLKLLLSKSNNKVLYAEAGDDFSDLLFSFLTFPLGSIIKLFGGNSGMGCTDNLYKSVEGLTLSTHSVSPTIKSMLVEPMVAPHFGCKNQLLDVKLSSEIYSSTSGCCECVSSYKQCTHGLANIKVLIKDLKEDGKGSGKGFLKGSAVFVVTDELSVKLLLPISFLHGLTVPISDIEERTLSIGMKEALVLLKASLLSKTALTHFAKSIAGSPCIKPCNPAS